MLDWYLDHGMKLTRIHRKLVYQKSRWLQPYIKTNQDEKVKAIAACDGMLIMFYKLINKSFYGKTLENVRNRQDITITNNEASYLAQMLVEM